MKKNNLFVYACIMIMFASCVQKVTVIGRSVPIAQRDSLLFKGDYYVDVINRDGDTTIATATNGIAFSKFPIEVNAYNLGFISKDLVISKKDQ